MQGMTREEILAMPADPALDALVAEKVLGLRLCREVPAYSTDITAAWELLDALRMHGFYASIHARHACTFSCELWCASQKGYARLNHEECLSATAPLAICRAALIATLG